MKPVYIEWNDIRENTVGWIEHEAAETWALADWTVKQIGWVFQETEENIVLVNQVCEAFDNVGNIVKIPKGCIIRMEDIVLPKPIS